jgi:hypothetical protein
MRDLNTLLSSAGVNMAGITLLTASAISGNGQYIVGQGDFSGATRPYVVRYYDGTPAPIGGATTASAVQSSVNDLSNARAGVMAQQQGFAAPLLGGDKPMGLGNEAGVFASAGSASKAPMLLPSGRVARRQDAWRAVGHAGIMRPALGAGTDLDHATAAARRLHLGASRPVPGRRRASRGGPGAQILRGGTRQPTGE